MSSETSIDAGAQPRADRDQFHRGGGLGRGDNVGRNGGRGSRDDVERMRAAMRDVTDTPARLTIVQTPSMVIITTGDVMLRAGLLKNDGHVGRLQTRFDRQIFENSDPDLIVVAGVTSSPVVDRVLVGMPSLFQRLHRSAQRGQFGALEQPWEGRVDVQRLDPHGWRGKRSSLLTVYCHNPACAAELFIRPGNRSCV